MARLVGDVWSQCSDIFLLFMLRWGELHQKRYCGEYVPTRLRVDEGPPQKVTVISNDIDEDRLISFLATARQFWLKRDVLCIDRIRRLLGRVADETNDSGLAEQLRAIKAEWKRRKKGQMAYCCDDGIVLRFSEHDFLDFMFHTKYFHCDARKMEALLSIEQHNGFAELNKGALEEYVWKFINYVDQHVPLVRRVLLSGVLPEGMLKRVWPFSEFDFEELRKRQNGQPTS